MLNRALARPGKVENHLYGKDSLTRRVVQPHPTAQHAVKKSPDAFHTHCTRITQMHVISKLLSESQDLVPIPNGLSVKAKLTDMFYVLGCQPQGPVAGCASVHSALRQTRRQSRLPIKTSNLSLLKWHGKHIADNTARAQGHEVAMQRNNIGHCKCTGSHVRAGSGVSDEPSYVNPIQLSHQSFELRGRASPILWLSLPISLQLYTGTDPRVLSNLCTCFSRYSLTNRFSCLTEASARQMETTRNMSDVLAVVTPFRLTYQIPKR